MDFTLRDEVYTESCICKYIKTYVGKQKSDYGFWKNIIMGAVEWGFKTNL